jgi:hypothetical protein
MASYRATKIRRLWLIRRRFRLLAPPITVVGMSRHSPFPPRRAEHDRSRSWLAAELLGVSRASTDQISRLPYDRKIPKYLDPLAFASMTLTYFALHTRRPATKVE